MSIKELGQCTKYAAPRPSPLPKDLTVSVKFEGCNVDRPVPKELVKSLFSTETKVTVEDMRRCVLLVILQNRSEP